MQSLFGLTKLAIDRYFPSVEHKKTLDFVLLVCVDVSRPLGIRERKRPRGYNHGNAHEVLRKQNGTRHSTVCFTSISWQSVPCPLKMKFPDISLVVKFSNLECGFRRCPRGLGRPLLLVVEIVAIGSSFLGSYRYRSQPTSQNVVGKNR